MSETSAGTGAGKRESASGGGEGAAPGHDAAAGAEAVPLGVVGRPNVGKSSLVNALCGKRGAVVSARPHTTRVASAWTGAAGGGRFALIDTPGLAQASAAREMRRQASGALEGTVAAIGVFERERRMPADALVEDLLCSYGDPASRIGVLNKVDLLADKNLLLPRMEQLASKGVAVLVPVSARTGEGIEQLRGVLGGILEAAQGRPMLRNLREPAPMQRLQERLRANLLRHYSQEVPHQVEVEVESERHRGENWEVALSLRPARKGQAAILLSRKGAVLRRVEAATARDISAHTGRRVRLRLRVRDPRG